MSCRAEQIGEGGLIRFRGVGVMREYERRPAGVWRDGLLMDLLAREFRGTNSAPEAASSSAAFREPV
jgi:hypothetical protein